MGSRATSSAARAAFPALVAGCLLAVACDSKHQADCATSCEALATCSYLPSALGRGLENCKRSCENSAASYDENLSYENLRKCIVNHAGDEPIACELIAECAVPPLSLDVFGRGSLQLFGWSSGAQRNCLPDKPSTDLVSDLCSIEADGGSDAGEGDGKPNLIVVRAVARSFTGEAERYSCKTAREQGVFVRELPAGPGRLLIGLTRSWPASDGGSEPLHECASIGRDTYVEAGTCVAENFELPALTWTACEGDAVSCRDGVDNDGDGAKDCADLDCDQTECTRPLMQPDASVPPPANTTTL